MSLRHHIAFGIKLQKRILFFLLQTIAIVTHCVDGILKESTISFGLDL
jgi:hypothetical protein